MVLEPTGENGTLHLSLTSEAGRDVTERAEQQTNTHGPVQRKGCRKKKIKAMIPRLGRLTSIIGL